MFPQFARFVPWVLGAVISLLTFLTMPTDTGTALRMAVNKDAALEQAVEILSTTPKKEVIEAVAPKVEE